MKKALVTGSSRGIGRAGMLYDGEDYYFSKEYHLRIVDRVGGDGSGRVQR